MVSSDRIFDAVFEAASASMPAYVAGTACAPWLPLGLGNKPRRFSEKLISLKYEGVLMPTEETTTRRKPATMSRAEIDARAVEKRILILNFLASEGYSTAAIIGDLIGVTRNRAAATLRTLERNSLVTTEDVEINGRKTVIYGISPTGAGLSNDPAAKPHGRGVIRPAHIPHRLDGQIARVKAERAGWSDWRAERQLLKQAGADAQTGKAWRKVPAAIATSYGRRIAIEIERNAKSPKRYAELIVAYILEIKDERYSEVHFVSPDTGIRDSVINSMRHVEYLQVAGERLQLNAKHFSRFRFFDYSAWPLGEGMRLG